MRVLVAVACLLPLLAEAQVTFSNVGSRSDSNNISGDITVTTGAEGFVLIHFDRHAGAITEPTVTLETVSPSYTLSFDSTPAHYRAYIWDSADITSMSCTTDCTWSWTGNSANDIYFLWGSLIDWDQANMGTSFTATDGYNTAVTSCSVAHAGTSGELVTVMHHSDAPSITHTWGNFGANEVYDSTTDGTSSAASYGNGGSSPETISMSGTDDCSAVAIVFEEAVTTPTLSSVAQNTQSTTTITFQATPSESGTWWWAVYNKDEVTNVPATCNAVETATGAIDSGTGTATGSSQSTFVADVVAPIRVVDFYVCVDGSTNGDSAVYSVLDAARTTLTGYATITDTGADGVSALSPLTPYTATANTTINTSQLSTVSQDDRFNANDLLDLGDGTGFAHDGPDVMASVNYVGNTIDLSVMSATSSQTGISISNLVNELGGALVSDALGTSNWGIEYETLTPGTHCDSGETCVTWDEDALVVVETKIGQENNYLCHNIYVQNYGNGDGTLAAPFDAAHPVCINNSAPVIDSETIEVLAFTTNEAITAVDIGAVCTDPDGGTPQSYLHAETSLDTGLSYSTVTELVTGTPTVENETGTTLWWLCRDAPYSWSIWTSTWYVVTTWTVGNYTGVDLSTALASIETDAPWRVGGDPYSTPGCNPSGNVVSQNPTASSEAGAYDTITLTLASGVNCSIVGRRGAKLRGVAVGL